MPTHDHSSMMESWNMKPGTLIVAPSDKANGYASRYYEVCPDKDQHIVNTSDYVNGFRLVKMVGQDYYALAKPQRFRTSGMIGFALFEIETLVGSKPRSIIEPHFKGYFDTLVARPNFSEAWTGEAYGRDFDYTPSLGGRGFHMKTRVHCDREGCVNG